MSPHLGWFVCLSVCVCGECDHNSLSRKKSTVRSLDSGLTVRIQIDAHRNKTCLRGRPRRSFWSVCTHHIPKRGAAARASVRVRPVLGTWCDVSVGMVPTSFKLQRARGSANQSGPQASPISVWQIGASYRMSSSTPACVHTRPSTACNNTPCFTQKRYLTMAHQRTVWEQQKSQRTSPGCHQRQPRLPPTHLCVALFY